MLETRIIKIRKGTYELGTVYKDHKGCIRGFGIETPCNTTENEYRRMLLNALSKPVFKVKELLKLKD